MADLALTAAQIAAVDPNTAVIYSIICAETITAGQSLFIDTDGKAQLADANVAGEQQTRYLALEGGSAGYAINALRRGRVYGFTLTSQAYDAPIFQSDTTGALADAAGTLEVPVGIVVGLTDGTTITKVLEFNPRGREDYA
jgi:hypothetical protein